jgi:hypothetical protein
VSHEMKMKEEVRRNKIMGEDVQREKRGNLQL